MYHKVIKGEHLVGIANRYGLPTDRIWFAPENRDLRSQRVNPNMLCPGDCIFIPELQLNRVDAATDKKHRFRFIEKKLWLRLDVSNLLNRDLAGASCTVVTESETIETAVSGSGEIECAIPPTASKVTIEIEQFRFPLLVGAIDPPDEKSGSLERLKNLGYMTGTDADDEGDLDAAIRKFQLENELPVTGTFEEATVDKLVEIHGS